MEMYGFPFSNNLGLRTTIHSTSDARTLEKTGNQTEIIYCLPPTDGWRI